MVPLMMPLLTMIPITTSQMLLMLMLRLVKTWMRKQQEEAFQR